MAAGQDPGRVLLVWTRRFPSACGCFPEAPYRATVPGLSPRKALGALLAVMRAEAAPCELCTVGPVPSKAHLLVGREEEEV